MARMDEAILAKKEKAAALRARGINPHPYSFNKQHTIAQVRESLEQTVTTAGRVMALRAHGKLWFADIADSTASVQVMLRQGELPEEEFSLLPLIDPGDFIGVTGTVTSSKTGEITVLATSLTVLGKALRPLPTAWNAAEDKEVRFRKRYLDMLINPRTKQVLDARFTIEKELRRYLQDEHNFVEVETPVFQPLYGGTNATPFTTHMNALDVDFYLRLAPELYLKRLIVGGYERIFEIARNFRNEGIDQTHQPEFTMIEWYEAYADYHRMMDVAEGLIKHLAQKVHGNLKITVDTTEISLEGTWPRVTMKQAIAEHLGLEFDALSDEELQTELSNRSIELTGTFTRGKVLFALFDKAVAHLLINPVWIIDYPRDISPLAKQHRVNPELAERFELYVGGKEIADGWSEITDAQDQRALFENEQQHMREGDAEAHPLDEDFLEAMEYGMPVLGGIGIGIDRLTMFLTNTWSIKEVIAFPTLRPIRPVKTQSSGLKPTETLSAGIDPAVLAQFPGMFYAFVVIEGVSIKKHDAALEEEKQQLLAEQEGLSTAEIEALKPIAAYRALFQATGVDVHKRRPSPEALLRRVASGKGIYTINTAVDAYNLAVIETGIALGGFDADRVAQPVTLRFTEAGESVLLLGDEEPTQTKAGELVYADQEKILTLDLNYRDNAATKLTEKTTSILLYADGAPGLNQAEVVAALVKGAENIVRYCGGSFGERTIVGTADLSKTSRVQKTTTSSTTLPTREETNNLMEQHIQNEALRHHVRMVAAAMEAYAKQLGEDPELWYATGLLHDLDWEEYPDEHPNKAIAEWLGEYPQELRDAVAGHAPERTGTKPESLLARYLFACDELSGFLHAYSLMRPEGFTGMKASSVKKKLKDKGFAANVSRDDIAQGFELISVAPEDHIGFLLTVFLTLS